MEDTIQPDPKFVMYSGDAEPKLLRPPQPGEVHFWTDTKGVSRTLNEGKWELVP